LREAAKLQLEAAVFPHGLLPCVLTGPLRAAHENVVASKVQVWDTKMITPSFIKGILFFVSFRLVKMARAKRPARNDYARFETWCERFLVWLLL
jgi:hypothetical protein